MSYDYGTAYYGMSGPGYYGGYSGGSYDASLYAGGSASDYLAGGVAADTAPAAYDPNWRASFYPGQSYVSGSGYQYASGFDRSSFYPNATYISGVGYVEDWKIPFYPGIDAATNSLKSGVAPSGYSDLAIPPPANAPARRSGGGGGSPGGGSSGGGGKPSSGQSSQPKPQPPQQQKSNVIPFRPQTPAQKAAMAQQIAAENVRRAGLGLPPLQGAGDNIMMYVVLGGIGLMLLLGGKHNAI